MSSRMVKGGKSIWGRASSLAPAAAIALASSLLLFAAQPVHAQTESVLYSFAGNPDGAFPIAGLVSDKKHNFYGTTWAGVIGYGSVFELTAAGTEKVLYSFGSQSGDGGNPYAGLVLDKKGNLYGTTQAGGVYGGGTVFMVTPAGVETVLYSFTTGPDGNQPIGGLVLDKIGNLYGTTQFGGPSGLGNVFKVTPAGVETVLYSFTGVLDGAYPQAGLVFDKAGNLYGTTEQGGDPSCNCGTVFKVTPTGTETVLYSFPAGGANGGSPQGALALGKKGYLYGTTSSPPGTVFKVSPTGKVTTLYSFTGAPDGSNPCGSLIFDKKGNLYGTTQQGGVSAIGTVFKLTPAGVETVLHSFTDTPDGSGPRYGGLVLDAAGNLYGTTAFGGANAEGTIFKVTP